MPLLLPGSVRAAFTGLLVALLVGCSAAEYSRDADRDVGALLSKKRAQVRAGRRERLVQPRDADLAPTDPGAPSPATPPAEPEVLEVGLVDSLRLATESNRDYTTRREGLYLQTLSLLGTRHVFSTRLAAALTYAFADGDEFGARHDVDFNASATRILELGGDLSLTLNTGFSSFDDGAPPDASSYDSGAALSLRQPLMRGFGPVISQEPLTQAERDLIYAVRDFELFRLDFAVDVATRFYDLVGRQRSIQNTRRNFDSFVFARRQAEALFQVGRSAQLDVLRAKRSELTAQNNLIAAEESYQLALDRYKIFLGLPVDSWIAIEPQEPEFVELAYTLDSALEAARANRLDLLTRRDRLVDSERAVRIAADGLRPDLDLNLGVGVDTPAATRFDDQALDSTSYDASVTFALPLDRKLQRNAHRASEIALVRARRDFDQFGDTLEVEIRTAFRELARRHTSLLIQRQLIEDQQKNVNIAQLRFARGDIPNRDVVEANQSLLEAENALISEQVNYEIARLQLLNDLGILFVDETGIFEE